MHLLVHADDTALLASSRESVEQRFKTMLEYCKENHICLQISKYEFIVINGNDKDREPFVFDDKNNFVLRLDVTKANRVFRTLGTAPSEFSKFEGPTYSVFYR